MVYSISDPEHAYYGIVEAMNYAEVYNIPVVVLSDKCIAETNISLPEFDATKIIIQRGLVPVEDITESSKRYNINNPIGSRWIPGTSDHVYYANGDEHDEKG
jgi:2-oxoglutarate ferredoxin oxidoreductase subunit alpha